MRVDFTRRLLSMSAVIALAFSGRALGQFEILAVPGEGWIKSSTTVSDDGRKVAYLVSARKQLDVVMNGKTVATHERIFEPTLRFSKDNQKLMYVAMMDNKSHAIVNGKPYGAFDEVFVASFSPDGSVHYVAGKRGADWFVEIGDKTFGPFLDTSVPSFSETGGSFAFAFKDSAGWRVQFNEKRSEVFEEIFDTKPIVSPDGTQCAYAFRKGSMWSIVCGDKVSGPYDNVYEGMVFSPDSSKVACGVTREKKHMMMMSDGKEYDAFAGFEAFGLPVVFSSDSKHFAYVAIQQAGVNQSCVIVLDGLPQRSYPQIGRPVFAPDQMTLGYFACTNLVKPRWIAVIDGIEYGPYSGVTNNIVFGATSKDFAYWAGDGTKRSVNGASLSADNYLVVNGKRATKQQLDFVSGKPIFNKRLGLGGAFVCKAIVGGVESFENADRSKLAGLKPKARQDEVVVLGGNYVYFLGDKMIDCQAIVPPQHLAYCSLLPPQVGPDGEYFEVDSDGTAIWRLTIKP